MQHVTATANFPKIDPKKSTNSIVEHPRRESVAKKGCLERTPIRRRETGTDSRR